MRDWQTTLLQAEKSFDQKRFDEAESFANQVLAGQPRSGRALQVLGLVQSEKKNPTKAIEILLKAVAIQPDLVPARNGLGLCYFQLDQLETALEHLNLALIFDPTHANAHFNRGSVWLKQGHYAEGWVEYEWRWIANLVAKTNVPVPRWDGAPLHGKRLLILTEQGIGDVLQFVRLLPMVKERGGTIIFACQKALQPFLRSLPWIDDWFPIDQEAPVNFDLQIPLLSLPAILGLNESNLPREVPYVFPEQDRVKRWGERIETSPPAPLRSGEGRKLKIGLNWQGNPTFYWDHNRSIPLKHYLKLLQVPGLSFVSLQKGHGELQIPEHSETLGLTIFDDRDADGTFLDTSAILAHLDLVITSDTSMAHLVGALGRPVWVLLGTGADWRWQLDRTDCVWYPTMRLFRQKTEGDWASVLDEVMAELRRVQAGDAQLPVGVDLRVESYFETSSPLRCGEGSPQVAESRKSSMASAPIVSTTPDASSPRPEAIEELNSVHTNNFPELLQQLNISVAVTTYQAGRLIFLRPDGSVLNTHFRNFDRPMGLAYQNGHLAVGSGVQIWDFYNVPLVAPKVSPEGRHDACFLPRRSHFTGDIDIHEMSFAPDGTLWFVNTRFCCLCTLDLHSSFNPQWRPYFISKLMPEDRCHLNGLALVYGVPKFVTALGTADTVGGWRQNKARGGVLMDVPSNQILIEGLSMPHSPRWYRDRLWLLESGDGSIGWVDLQARQYHKICELPGFTRGIDFCGPLAFIGLSQVRESAIFSGIPIAERLKDRIAGVYVVNIETGQLIAYLNFTSGVHEIFAVQVLPNLIYPELINENNDWLRHSYVIPDHALNS
jgi:uncharacterized protein (TIGR03032 family)